MTAATAPTGIRKYIPILGWLPKYKSGWLRLDLVAGLTAAAVVIPQAMAYATVAGLPVEVGLYTALTPMVVVCPAGYLAAAQCQCHVDDCHADGDRLG